MKTMTASSIAFLRFLILIALLLSGCAPRTTDEPSQDLTVESTTNQAKLTVFAAASLAEPFEEIRQAFEAENPGITVVFSFAGSHQLAQQIAGGAPADVFASANAQQMVAAITAGSVDGDSVRVFAENRLAVIVPSDNPAQIDDLNDLAKPGIKLVLAAEEVPAGQYSLEFMSKAGADPAFGADYEAKVLANVVSHEENVRSVLTKVQLGEADAGIVYSTDAAVGNGNSGMAVQVIEIPEDLNVIARYPIAPVSAGQNQVIAQRFVEFILSQTAQDILNRYGFGQIKQ